MSAARLRLAIRELESYMDTRIQMGPRLFTIFNQEAPTEVTSDPGVMLLHRTVAVQLTMLRAALDATDADFSPMQWRRELALADAILGGAS